VTDLFQDLSAMQAAFAAFSCQFSNAQHFINSSIRRERAETKVLSTGCVHNLQVIHYSFCCSVTHSFIHSVTPSLAHSFFHLFVHSFTYAFSHSFIHSFIHSLSHSLTQSVSQSRCVKCQVQLLNVLLEFMQLPAEMVCVCRGQAECRCLGRAQMLEG